MNDARSLRRCLLQCSSRQAVSDFLSALEGNDFGFLESDWATLARDDQWPEPVMQGEGGPSTWLFMGGRGAGKTRAGAEWVRRKVLDAGAGRRDEGPMRIALVGPSLNDVRQIMVEGASGLVAVHADRRCEAAV